MRVAWVIAKREMFSFFVSPMAYVVLTVWLLWSGVSFYFLAVHFASSPSQGAGDNPLTLFFGGTMLFYLPVLVFVPVFTMRLLAEERRTGTIETLLTAPVTDVGVVLGKYLAALVFWLVLWVPTLMYVWLTSRYGDVDLGTVACTYLGILGVGLYYSAIGLLMSAVAKNQIVAALLSFFVLGGLFVLGLGEFIFQEDETRAVFSYLSIWGHMGAFSKGIVDSRYVVFDVSVAALAIFLAVRALEARRLGP